MYVIVLIIPLFLLRVPLRQFIVFGDDFDYTAEARDWATTKAHLFEPHNTHVVPLFRIWCYVMFRVANGRLEAWPIVLAAASFLALTAAQVAVGIFVARETRDGALTLLAMALLGVSSVIEPAVSWFSAGQALWAGTAIVISLIAAQSWRLRGGAIRFGALVVSIMAAPLVWSGGLAAGPAAAVYLGSEKQRGSRVAVVLILGLTTLSAGFIVARSRTQIKNTAIVWERHRDAWPRPVQAALHTAQAIPEALVLGTLGLEAATSAGQGLLLSGLFCLALARMRSWNASLFWPGVMIVGFSYLMVFYFRGNLPYSSLRSLGWYHAIPAVGWVLLLAGMVEPRAGESKGLTRGDAMVVVGVVAVLLILHHPRVDRRFSADATLAARVARQRAEFASLDRVGAIARERGWSREMIRREFGHVEVFGWPAKKTGTDGLDLLELPEPGGVADRAEAREILGQLFSRPGGGVETPRAGSENAPASSTKPRPSRP